MKELLARIFDAHGRMHRWNGHEKVEATILSGGAPFPFKSRGLIAYAVPSHFWTPDRLLPLSK
jgi:hypothetical protein